MERQRPAKASGANAILEPVFRSICTGMYDLLYETIRA